MFLVGICSSPISFNLSQDAVAYSSVEYNKLGRDLTNQKFDPVKQELEQERDQIMNDLHLDTEEDGYGSVRYSAIDPNSLQDIGDMLQDMVESWPMNDLLDVPQCVLPSEMNYESNISGKGTKDEPFVIHTNKGLVWLVIYKYVEFYDRLYQLWLEYQEQGIEEEPDWTDPEIQQKMKLSYTYCELDADISFSGYSWEYIGGAASEGGFSFVGEFDGKGHAIKGLHFGDMGESIISFWNTGISMGDMDGQVFITDYDTTYFKNVTFEVVSLQNSFTPNELFKYCVNTKFENVKIENRHPSSFVQAIYSIASMHHNYGGETAMYPFCSSFNGDTVEYTLVVPEGDVSGTGEKDDPYVIYTPRGWLWLMFVNYLETAKSIQLKSDASTYKYVKLGNDIDLKGCAYDFWMMETLPQEDESPAFMFVFNGELDGDGHSLLNVDFASNISDDGKSWSKFLTFTDLFSGAGGYWAGVSENTDYVKFVSSEQTTRFVNVKVQYVDNLFAADKSGTKSQLSSFEELISAKGNVEFVGCEISSTPDDVIEGPPASLAKTYEDQIKHWQSGGEYEIEGQGTELSPYVIKNVTDWVWLMTKVTSVIVPEDPTGFEYPYLYVSLGADLDFDGFEYDILGLNSPLWQPLLDAKGSISGMDDFPTFFGSFKGNGHTISNLFLNQSIGFFPSFGAFSPNSNGVIPEYFQNKTSYFDDVSFENVVFGAGNLGSGSMMSNIFGGVIGCAEVTKLNLDAYMFEKRVDFSSQTSMNLDSLIQQNALGMYHLYFADTNGGKVKVSQSKFNVRGTTVFGVVGMFIQDLDSDVVRESHASSIIDCIFDINYCSVDLSSMPNTSARALIVAVSPVSPIVPQVMQRNSPRLTVSGCEFYGNILANAYLGAVVGLDENHGLPLVLNDCKNYCNFASKYFTCGGFIGCASLGSYSYSEDVEISNCENYGDMYCAFDISLLGSSSIPDMSGIATGGFIGYIYSGEAIALKFTNCSNYGNCYSGYNQGGFIGAIRSGGVESTSITFEGCKNFGDMCYPIVNYGTGTMFSYAGGFVGTTEFKQALVFDHCLSAGNFYATGTSDIDFANRYIYSQGSYYYTHSFYSIVGAFVPDGSGAGEGLGTKGNVSITNSTAINHVENVMCYDGAPVKNGELKNVAICVSSAGSPYVMPEIDFPFSPYVTLVYGAKAENPTDVVSDYVFEYSSEQCTDSIAMVIGIMGKGDGAVYKNLSTKIYVDTTDVLPDLGYSISQSAGIMVAGGDVSNCYSEVTIKCPQRSQDDPDASYLTPDAIKEQIIEAMAGIKGGALNVTMIIGEQDPVSEKYLFGEAEEGAFSGESWCYNDQTAPVPKMRSWLRYESTIESQSDILDQFKKCGFETYSGGN